MLNGIYMHEIMYYIAITIGVTNVVQSKFWKNPLLM